MSRTAARARLILADAHAIATDIDAALATLHDSLGGYPASTPGAAPSTAPTILADGGDVPLTQTERDAGRPDRARLDQIELARLLRRMARDAARARTICGHWANPADTATSVARKLAGDDRSLWCHNCLTHGVNNVRAEGRTECKFCGEFRRTYGTRPNRRILDIHGHRNVTPQDAVRILDEDAPGWRKTMPKPKAPKAKAGQVQAA